MSNAEQPAHRSSSANARASIWLVEDSALATANVLRILGALHDVTCFSDGETMIERLAGNAARPVVLLTDWELPGVSGLDVLRFVRERYDEITLPVLMLTGVMAHDRASFSEPFAAGANDYLAKPYSDQELLARVATLVRVGVQARRLDIAAQFEKQLIGIVSHDLLNPVTSIIVGAEALQRRAALDETSAAIAGRIRTSGDRCARMIRDLLDFTSARLGGGISIVAATVDARRLAHDVLQEVRLNHGARRFELAAHGELAATWDGDRIAQVLTNLVVNALKYGAPDAPITVTVDGSVEDWITLSVHNDGPPIAPLLRAQLFEPLQRGQAAAAESTSRDKTNARSIGLGLYIVKEVVERHGGSVVLHSEAGHGTTFSARLPRTARTTA